MVDFTLTEEQLAMQRLAREFAQKEIKPVALDIDAIRDPEQAFPVDLFKKSFELGFHKAQIPEKYGGLGLDCVTTVIIWEEFAAADAGFCVSYQGHQLAIVLALNAGTEEQLEPFLRSITEGEGGLSAIAVTEPDVGPCWMLSQPGEYAMQTTAVPDGSDWVINGSKCFITTGGTPVTKWYNIVARTDMSKVGLGAHSWFLVWPDTPGLRVGKGEDKMGQRLSHNVQLFFEDMRVPQSQLIGGQPGTMTVKERLTTTESFTVIGGLMVGLARAAYEEALDYAKQRLIVGRPSIQYQLVAAKLADMYMDIEAARALLWKAARYSDTHPQPDMKLGYAVKVLTSDVAVKVASEAVQIWGGYGVIKPNLVEKLYRDAKMTQVYECPNEILRLVIAKMLEVGL